MKTVNLAWRCDTRYRGCHWGDAISRLSAVGRLRIESWKGSERFSNRRKLGDYEGVFVVPKTGCSLDRSDRKVDARVFAWHGSGSRFVSSLIITGRCFSTEFFVGFEKLVEERAVLIKTRKNVMNISLDVISLEIITHLGMLCDK